MRAIIDIQQNKLDAIKEFCEKKHISRAELIRRSIDFYLETHQSEPTAAFGILKGYKIDGLKYQKKIREEW